MSNCPICDSAIDATDRFMLAFDLPYLNVYIHKSCLQAFRSMDKPAIAELVKKQLNTPIITKKSKNMV